VVVLAVYNGVGRDRPPYELHRWGTPGNLYHLVLPAAVPLLSLIFAGAMALFSSLQVVFSTPQKIARLGGYLSHAGIGVLLIGVVTSEVNDREQQVSLVKNQPQEVMGYQVTYGGMYVPGASAKPALDLTFAKGSESFKAPTPMYFSKYNNQYMYAPYIHKYPGFDLYIAPEGPPTNTADMAKRSVEMLPGQQTEMINGVSIRFVNYDVSGHQGAKISVGAAVDVLRDGKTERIVPRWEAEPTQSQRTSIPAMTADGNVTVEIGELNADTKAATLIVGGHALGGPLGPPQEIALIKVSTKPMINLVWLATLLVMCGGLLTVKRSFGDLARAEARERSDYANEEETGGPGPDGVESEPHVKRRSKQKEAVAGAHLAEGTANP
jgi:cytochrome c-type biogenesis protein CcmF